MSLLHRIGSKRAIADNYNLNINIICERKNLKNRRTEILITNYKNETEKRNDLF